MQPINRLPKDIFILIPRFFTNEEWAHDTFPMNRPLITMTHVCRSWRNTLIATPSLWTQIDFSTSEFQQAEGFLGRSRKQLLDVYQFFESEDDVEPFLSATLGNISRLRWLKIESCFPYFERVLIQLRRKAPELKHLIIGNKPIMADREMTLPSTIFKGQLPKLTSLSLHNIRTNLCDFNLPSLTRFIFITATKTSVLDLTSSLKGCPSLEFVQLNLDYMPQLPTPPPRKRVQLAALKELKLNETACTSGLLDHLILPKCTEMTLRGHFTGEKSDYHGNPASRIHPSSIDHLPVMRGIIKAVAMPNSCILSGSNGNLRIWCFERTRGDFNAGYFTSFSPIPVLDIRELWVGQRGNSTRGLWGQTLSGVLSAFKVFSKVEGLTILRCKTEAFFTTLGSTTDGGILLPGLRRLTIYVGSGDLDVKALVQCAKTRKEHFRPIEEVDVVLGRELDASFVQETESLREFVGQLSCRVGKAPKLDYNMEDIPGCKVGLR